MINRAATKFLIFGSRVFTHDGWHKVPYQPLLYFFLWGATVRILVSAQAPIPFAQYLTEWSEMVWATLSLVCPPLALLSWWLIVKSRYAKAALIGLWTRLGADIGQFAALLVYHLLTLHAALLAGEAQFYLRYLTGATLTFVLLLVVRDIWALLATERLAGKI